MTAKEKYNEEKDELRLARMNRILSCAFELFSINGIDNVAMTDIARKAEIGVASLYRYYETKDEIAIRTIIWAWENQRESIVPPMLEETFKNASGLEQLRQELGVFSSLLENQPAFLRYIYFFDSYAVRTQIDTQRLADYEKEIQNVQNVVVTSIKKGIEDGSVKDIYKEKEVQLYFALTHALFNSAQKLSLSGKMLNMDSSNNGKIELDNLVSILIEGIKNQ